AGWMSPTPASDAYSGWSFDEKRVPGGGVVLGRVRHRGFLFARDIRVVSIWVADHHPTEDSRTPRQYRLGTSELPEDPPAQLPQAPPSRLIAPFTPILRRSASYTTTGGVLGSGSRKLRIVQHYLFTPYGKEPPHEPAGILEAARLYPLVS